MRIGDIVGRKSYGCDIFFRIVGVRGDKVVLKGLTYRIEADAPREDLTVLKEEEWVNHQKQIEQRVNQILSRIEKEDSISTNRNTRNSSYKKLGTVLHLDGDNEYLKKCQEYYGKFNIPVIGKHIEEAMQPKRIRGLLENYRPDILVLTGHDGIVKGTNNNEDIKSYRNSNYFVEAVKEARKYEPDYDNLIIFAGACQSYYEAIMQSGANYASSPDRILIQALDPVLVVQRVATTSIREIIEVPEVIKNTITGFSGIGGVQTRGKYREGMPAFNKKV